jgi:hypothetical protein
MQSHFCQSFSLIAELLHSNNKVVTYAYVVQHITYFSWSILIISDLKLRSLTQFELMLVQGERLGSSFSLVQVEIQFSQHLLLKRLSFPQCIFGLLCQKSDGCSCVGLCQGFYSVPMVSMYFFFFASTMLFLLLWLYSIV